jgi:hypothetical protein
MRQDERRLLPLAERDVRTRCACRPFLQPHVGRQPEAMVSRGEDSP